MNNIKERLSAIGKTQVWLLKELRKRGVAVQSPQLCNAINGVYTYPKAKSILLECDKILTDAEQNILT